MAPGVAIGIPGNLWVPGGDDPIDAVDGVGSVACVALVDRLRDLAPRPPVVLGRELEVGAGDESCAV